MAPSVNTSGSITTTGSEQDLATITAAGTYILVVDCNAMANGDEIELRIYGKARSTDTERLYRSTYAGPAVLAEPLIESLPIVSPHHLRASIWRRSGTDRAYPWAIYSL